MCNFHPAPSDDNILQNQSIIINQEINIDMMLLTVPI